MASFRNILRSLLRRDNDPEVSADLSGLRPDGSPYATCYVRMESLVDDLLACFPRYDQPPEESLPSEIPHPYTYSVSINQAGKMIELQVYHQDPELFPGLWRHPDGTHLYFQGDASQRFMNIVETSGINNAGANKTSHSSPDPTESK